MSDTSSAGDKPADTAPQKHTLLKPHKHAGRDLAPGETLNLRPDQAKRLRAEKKIK